MPKTAIITDTDSNLPLDLAKKYNIIQVPIIIQFNEQSFRDIYEIDNVKTFARIDTDGILPTTSAPSPGQFAEAYQAAFDAGYDLVLCFTVSSEMSATYSSALSAADLFPGKDITVTDTKNLSAVQSFVVLAAAEALEKGMPKGNVVAIAQDVGKRSHFFAALSTLKYLTMSERIGHLAAGLARFLDAKPILTIRNGKLEMLERVRTQNKAWGRVVELTVAAAVGNQIERMAIVHVSALDAAKQIEQQLRSYLPCPDEILYIELTPGLSVHTGTGLVGVAIVTGQK